MQFEYPTHLNLARIPTPIEKLARLSKHLEGPQILIKRDDLTGVALSGNKVRKLEFLLADALAQGCDCVITCGGPQSNHARATAVAAAKLGLKSHLVLRNSVGAQMEGNAFLSRLVGAEVTNVSAEQYMRIDEVMQRTADELRDQGHKPYVIPEGGSNELGVLGYVKAVEETLAQLKRSKTKIHHVFVAVGSGGTYAGLLLGKHLFDLSAEIHGINVCDTASYFEDRILRLLKETKKRFGLGVNLTKKDLHLIDGYVGKGYGLSSQEEIDLIKSIARTEGVILDPVYTGKAMLGMVDQIRQGRFKAGETLLFFHTGGIYGLFPKRSLFF